MVYSIYRGHLFFQKATNCLGQEVEASATLRIACGPIAADVPLGVVMLTGGK